MWSATSQLDKAVKEEPPVAGNSGYSQIFSDLMTVCMKTPEVRLDVNGLKGKQSAQVSPEGGEAKLFQYELPKSLWIFINMNFSGKTLWVSDISILKYSKTVSNGLFVVPWHMHNHILLLALTVCWEEVCFLLFFWLLSISFDSTSTHSILALWRWGTHANYQHFLLKK